MGVLSCGLHGERRIHSGVRLPMTVGAIGKSLAAELHLQLEPLGFSRRGATFSRGGEGYTELFHIAGCRWNSGDEPWLFDFDVAVRIEGIPMLPNTQGLWREAHAVGRANRVVASAPPQFSVTTDSVRAVADQLVLIVCEASAALPPLIEQIWSRALQGLLSPLPVPASWGA